MPISQEIVAKWIIPQLPDEAFIITLRELQPELGDRKSITFLFRLPKHVPVRLFGFVAGVTSKWLHEFFSN